MIVGMSDTEHPIGGADFEFDLAGPLFDQIRDLLDRITAVALSDENIDFIGNRPGVYLLFHKSDPVYVGKADDSVRVRLRRHRTTISGCRNIDPKEVTFKSVCFAKTWDPFKPEDHLIAYYGTMRGDGWNNKGFGSNDPGVHRGNTELVRDSFYKRFPINTDWVCASIEPGTYPAIDLLRAIKTDVPFWFKFQGNRKSNKPKLRKLYDEANPDYDATTVVVPRKNMTARELLVEVARALPHGWQATITPSHMLLYREINTVYPDMTVVWPEQPLMSSD